jgi:hypothetical protein
MNPITQRHRMWARTSGPDRQAQRPAHHYRQRQRHRTRTALAGAGILGTAAITAVLPGSSLPASAAPPSARGAAGQHRDLRWRPRDRSRQRRRRNPLGNALRDADPHPASR